MEAVAENRLNSIQAIFKEMNPDERKHALYALSSKIGDSETILQTIDSNQLESLTQSVAKYQVMNRALEMI